MGPLGSQGRPAESLCEALPHQRAAQFSHMRFPCGLRRDDVGSESSLGRRGGMQVRRDDMGSDGMTQLALASRVTI